jgi:hypothetical protein
MGCKFAVVCCFDVVFRLDAVALKLSIANETPTMERTVAVKMRGLKIPDCNLGLFFMWVWWS